MDSLLYYGLGFQVGDFGLDIYLTQVIFGVVEVPARLSSIPMMEKLGRKWSQLCTLTLAGVMCVIIIFIPGGTRLCSTPSPSLPWPEPLPHPLQDRGLPQGVGVEGRHLSIQGGVQAQVTSVLSVWLSCTSLQIFPQWPLHWLWWGSLPRLLPSPFPMCTLLSSSPPSSGESCWGDSMLGPGDLISPSPSAPVLPAHSQPVSCLQGLGSLVPFTKVSL